MKNKKIINRMKEYFVPGSYSFLKPEIIAEKGRTFPLMLNLEPTLACNLRCFFCPSHNQDSKEIGMRTSGMMEWKLYQKVMNESAEQGPLLILNMHKDGESTLHPKFVKMIRYAKEIGAAEVIHFNTNATMRKKEKIDELLESGVDDITMSIDAFYPENYKMTKGVDSLELVVENVEYFLKRRNEMGLDRPFIRAKMIGLKTEESQEEFKLFKEYWEPKADEVQCQQIHNFAGGLDFQREQENRYPCEFPFYSTAINWDGTITICHRDFNNKDVFGNASDQSIKEIYLGRKYQNYLQAMIQGKDSTLPICAGCDNWKDGPNLGVSLTKKLCLPK